jgi:neutral ceramidase
MCARQVSWVCCLAGILALLWPVDGRGADVTWRVGTARVVITPDQPLWMAGYASRDKPASEKFTDLWVRSCVLEDSAGERAVLVSLDLIGCDRGFAQSICDTLKQQYGLERKQIALCFSHTHSGPVIGRALEVAHYRHLGPEQQAAIDAYTARLPGHVVDCVGRALADLTPCELLCGSGTATIAVNRRNNPEPKVPELRANGQLVGPVDHDVPVLAARAPDGNWKAVWFGYACHATTLSDFQWCGDYPGYAAAELETKHAGTTALFWAGCGADQNPLPRRRLELAQQYGAQLATAVEDVLSRPDGLTPIPSVLRTAWQEIALPLSPAPTEDELRHAATAEDRYVRARATMYLERLAAGQPLPTTVPYPIQVWELGNAIQFVCLGGEVVVDYALRLKSELRGKQTWVAGYANDVMAYIPSQRVLAEGGYEGKDAMVYYGLLSPWTADVEPLIITAVHALSHSVDVEDAVQSGEAVGGSASGNGEVR